MDSKMVAWQQAQIEGFGNATSEDELFKVLSSAAGEFGFDYCAYGMRMPLPVSNPKMYLMNNYPTAWQERYAKENYLAIDPTVAHGMRSVSPLIWAEPIKQASQEFWEDARGHGLKAGWAQSSFNPQGSVGMLTLARSDGDLCQAELRQHSMQMSWLVHAIHEAMTRVVSTSQEPQQKAALTAREIEVLRWTADGKTSGEVGQIMDISERTVNFHINNSLEKLDANNKTAGVIKAALRRLL